MAGVLLLSLAAVLSPGTAFAADTASGTQLTGAQTPQKTVTGIVTDTKGEPLIGVFVTEDGTSNGGSTDIDGKFTLKVASNAELLFSCIGFEDLKVNAEGKSDFKVSLKRGIFETQ